MLYNDWFYYGDGPDTHSYANTYSYPDSKPHPYCYPHADS